MCGGGGSDKIEPNVYERELVDQADRRLAEYNEMYVPLEAQHMADIQRYRGDTFKQGSMDKTVNAARMRTSAGVKAGANIDPGQGNMMMQAIGTEQQQGTAGAMAAMGGLQTAEDLYARGQSSMAALGRQQSGQAMQMTSNMAQQEAGMLAAEKAAQQTVSSAKWGAAGSVAGMAGASAYGNWGSDGVPEVDPSAPINGTGGNSPYTPPGSMYS